MVLSGNPSFSMMRRASRCNVCVASRNVTLRRLHAHNHSLAHTHAHLQNGERVLKLHCTEVSTAGTANMPNLNFIQEHLPNEPP
mgnify:CR=1 FL=1